MVRYDPGMQGTFAWQGIPVTEDLTRVQGIVAGCGEAALLVILNGLKGVPTDPATLGNIISTAEARREVGTGGVSSPSGLEGIASGYGVTLQSGNLSTLINQYAGTRPIIVGVSNARAFGGRDSGVFGHYVTIVGRTAGGSLIVNDPNQSSKFGFFDVYTESEFINAHPFWAAVPATWSPTSGTGSGSGSIGNTISSTGSSQGGFLGIQWPDWFTNIGNWITGPNTWFNAQRILKIVFGVTLLIIAFIGVWNGSSVGQATNAAAGKVVETAAIAA